MQEVLTETLLKLVRLDGPSRAERPVADFLNREFRRMGYRVEEDDAAQVVRGNAGNLFCYPPHFDRERPALMIVAHMDTVKPTRLAVPVVSDGRITSDNEHALGVDNRAGVTVLLHGAENLLKNCPVPANVVFLFTVCEELGPVASHTIQLPDNVIMGAIFDSSARPGTFIQSTFGAKEFVLEIRGKDAHAGIEPEKGVNAIQLVSHILSQIPMGRISPDLTCNVGWISGGGPTNVVPDRVSVRGEVRSTYQKMLESFLQKIDTTAREVCSRHGGESRFRTRSLFTPYKISQRSPIYSLVTSVLRAVGLRPNPIHYSGGSDANTLNERGLPTINLGIGAQHPHAADEFILIEDLVSSYRIVTKMCEEFASGYS